MNIKQLLTEIQEATGGSTGKLEGDEATLVQEKLQKATKDLETAVSNEEERDKIDLNSAIVALREVLGAIIGSLEGDKESQEPLKKLKAVMSKLEQTQSPPYEPGNVAQTKKPVV